VAEGFRSWVLPTAVSFEELLASARFEELGKGRRGTVLVTADARGVPIVRTTTQYQAPAQPFLAVHDRIAQACGGGFNNALIEHYTNAYSTMKRHSDQALDLADGSTIAIYSCYRDPDRPSRRLVVKPKGEGQPFDIPLAHGSVVAFSLETNRRFTHTIALTERAPVNDWLGLTLRTSKTVIRGGRFADGTPLTLATEEQRRDFYQLRKRENDEVDFVWPAITYTLSASDAA
jgi:alkylated DNA repair dioxygenase AlkB